MSPHRKPVLGKRVWITALLAPAALILAADIWRRPLSYYQTYARTHLFFRGASSRYLRVKGIRIHYYVMGPLSGPPIVLIHGLGGRSEDWMPMAPYLARAGFRVYLLDLPGYGKSDQPSGFSYSMSDQGSIVLGFMDLLGLRCVDLGGWSMGGWIAQRIAGQHPERIRKLMLFCSAGLYVRPSWDVGLFIPRDAAELDELYALLMPNPLPLPGFVVRDVLREAARRAWVIRRTLHNMLTGREATDRILPRLLMPVLLVWGELDRIIPLAQGEKMHALIPYAQLHVVEGCGHLAPNLCADQVAPIAVEFLRK